jgi:hypothetical protein
MCHLVTQLGISLKKVGLFMLDVNMLVMFAILSYLVKRFYILFWLLCCLIALVCKTTLIDYNHIVVFVISYSAKGIWRSLYHFITWISSQWHLMLPCYEEIFKYWVPDNSSFDLCKKTLRKNNIIIVFFLASYAPGVCTIPLL